MLIDSVSHYAQPARKQEDGSWKFEEITGLQASLHIRAIDHRLPMREIYDRIKL